MGLITLDCKKCGASLTVEDTSDRYRCKYCGTSYERDYSSGVAPTPKSLMEMGQRAYKRGEYGKAMQFIEQGLAIDPNHTGLLKGEELIRAKLAQLSNEQYRAQEKQMGDLAREAEAEQYHLQAEFIYHELSANLQVYGGNSAWHGGTPANVDLALQYLDRCLQLVPDNAKYLNLKALFLWEGKNTKQAALPLLERAAALAPDDINVQENLRRAKSKSGNCFIATAAYGTPFAQEIDTLRLWRDEHLSTSVFGRAFVKTYYTLSPPVARFIENKPRLRAIVRRLLDPLVRHLAIEYPPSRFRR